MVAGGWSRKVGVGAVLLSLALAACSGADGDEGGAANLVDETDQAEIAGVTVVPVASARHVNETVDYDTTPPAGGDHNSAWQNCGFYTVELVPEHVVHSLEHGAVWITYRPDADAATIAAIESLAADHEYVLASPLADNPAPIVLSAWGRQAAVQSADDPLVGEFLDTYMEDGPTTPEPGATCAGAVGVPPDQPTSLVR
jgi:hypothetical protein